jgi:hypothetical protein
MKIFKCCCTTIFGFIFLCSLAGCFNSYNKALARAGKDKSYMIMHSGVDVYRITSVEVEKSKKQFTVQLNKVDSIHLANMNNPASSGEKLVHVYMKDSTSYTLDEPHTIPLSKVASIKKVD